MATEFVSQKAVVRLRYRSRFSFGSTGSDSQTLRARSLLESTQICHQGANMKTFQRIGFGLGLSLFCLAATAATDNRRGVGGLGGKSQPQALFSGGGSIGPSLLSSEANSFAKTSNLGARPTAPLLPAASTETQDELELSSASVTLLAGIGIWALLARRRLNR